MATIFHFEHSRPSPGAPAVLFFALLVALLPTVAAAQMLHLDPVPWSAVTDSTAGPALVVEVTRFEESKFDWSANRIQLTLLLPMGDRGEVFVRMPHYTADFGSTSLWSRWPSVEGGEEAVAAADTFWTERRVSSFGQLEVGANRWAYWPLLGRTHYGAALGLPVGTDRLYPFSSVSFPLRLEVRKVLELRSGGLLFLEAGYLYNVDSGQDRLDETAFPDGWRGGAVLQLGSRRTKKLLLDYHYENREGRRSQTAGLQIQLPWLVDGSWGLRADRELAGSLNRYAEWRFSLVWRFDTSLSEAQAATTAPAPAPEQAPRPAPEN